MALNRVQYDGNDIRFPEHLQWKYWQGQFGPAAIGVCTDTARDGLIVGKVIGMPREATEGGRSGGVSLVTNFLVESGAVGREAGDLLVSAATEYFREKKAALSGCPMLPNTDEFKLLRRWGYLVCQPPLEPQPFPVFREPHQPFVRQGPAQSIGNWFFTMGDYDVV
jgi:hypothetical protein